MGTRFLPAAKAQPKEMLAVVDKPVIQYIVEEAVAAANLQRGARLRQAILQRAFSGDLATNGEGRP